jgi:RNA polymerase sigma factor, sigma-70 family
MNIEKEFIDILLEHKQIIYKVCFMYAKDKDAINDLYQETVLNLWRGYPNFRKESQVSTWIYQVSLNTCISNLRKKKNVNFVPLQMEMDIYEDCEKNELLQEMYQLIKQLNKLERIYILLWLEEKTYDEIAEITGVSRNNVAIRLHRIKEKLKTLSNK